MQPADVILARRRLMSQIGELMLPIDLIEAGQQQDPALLRQNAGAIATKLAALPDQFPPETNRYDAAKEPDGPFETLALPAIWASFDAFLALGKASTQAAEAMAGLEDDKALPAAGKRLRESCTTCHTSFLRASRPAQPPPDLGADVDDLLDF